MIPNLELHTKLSNLFHIGFNFITAENTPKPKWRTNRKYRLTRGEFVKLYSDKLSLLGVSFGTTTTYFMLDIDFGSKYHPSNDPTALPKIRQILEKVGIVRIDLIRSSQSGGIHLYGCLPKNVSTIRLATLLHVTLIDAGIELAKGQLECFPNPKPYGEKGHFTYYNPHRVPLQPNSGSLLLSEDGDIILSAENLTHESMLAGFLARTEQSAQAQDMELLNRLMDACYAKYTSNAGIAKYQHHHQDYTEVAREWKENLELTIQTIGWTAHGQTNTLLPNFIAYGVVFLGFKGEELENCLYDLILSAPGYQEHCRHQHEIKAVIKGWVENTERQGYYVEYCGFPARSGLNPHLIAKRIKANRNEHNENLAKRTEQRLNAILAALTEIPDRVGAKIAAIRTKSLELFGEAISRNTLYKPAYKSLWVKAEGAKCDINLAENPTPPSDCIQTSVVTEMQAIRDRHDRQNPAAQTQSQKELSHTPSLYETYVEQSHIALLHHQLQLHCINLFCQSILDLQLLSGESELQQDRSNIQSTSVILDTQNLPAQNIYSTEDFKDDLQSEGIADISNGNGDGEFESSCEPNVQIDIDKDPASAIEIGTKLRRNSHQIGQKTYAALVNCQVVSANGLDWVVRDRDGSSWNVSYHALESGIWEIESDLAVVRDVGVRSVVEIARQMRINLAAIPDALLLEFLHHPDLDAIQRTIELAERLASARSRQQIEELGSSLDRSQKMDLWRVLTVEERSVIETIMAQPHIPPLSSSVVEVETSVESWPPLNCELFVGVMVNTLTGLVGVVKHVFRSVAKPFLVYHESLGRTILYRSEDLRLSY
ncbi:hypothetical protein [Chamaesiphon minutus]|uniref:Uncharacterized protein n=1 Tax=Chamaesiphon minutus (strain ATCC 27169 / PCC 6605) TaxID=1173020 RepID=K9UEE5_CHAP6|nr:hypothetical protein [Chamaesiphon minutus]AFY92771.1 hypothetical protein Cha6605_1621 [Chamaesiphon minutus PCC 6605]